jgi:hypothetical protein
VDNRIRKWKHLPKAVQEAFLELYKQIDSQNEKIEIMWDYISDSDLDEIERRFNKAEELEKLK